MALKPIFCTLLLLSLFALSASSKAQRPVPPPPVGDLSAAPTGEEDARDRLTRNMAKKANEERHLALKNDAEKLLRMAVELKAYVDKSNEHVLSVDVVKKAEEIEKLAKEIRELIRG